MTFKNRKIRLEKLKTYKKMGGEIKYLIVEDEQKSRELLLKKIQMVNNSKITCIGMAANATEALLLARMTTPDFILLDINLPGKNGFDLLKDLNEEGISPEVIFTSAHTEINILLNALKHSPVTYLVKPVDLGELDKAIRKVCSQIPVVSNDRDMHDKIRFPGHLGPLFISPENLLMVKADAHNSRLFLSNGKDLQVYQGISKIERLSLAPFSGLFIRPDRSTIINKSKITSIHTKKNECILSGDTDTISVRISGNGLKKLLKTMVSITREKMQ